MNDTKMRKEIVSLNGRRVAVNFAPTKTAPRGFLVFGLLRVYKDPFEAVLYSDKGNKYIVYAENTDFIVEVIE